VGDVERSIKKKESIGSGRMGITPFRTTIEPRQKRLPERTKICHEKGPWLKPQGNGVRLGIPKKESGRRLWGHQGMGGGRMVVLVEAEARGGRK